MAGWGRFWQAEGASKKGGTEGWELLAMGLRGLSSHPLPAPERLLSRASSMEKAASHWRTRIVKAT